MFRNPELNGEVTHCRTKYDQVKPKVGMRGKGERVVKLLKIAGWKPVNT